MAIKSIELQLVRVETCGCAEGYSRDGNYTWPCIFHFNSKWTQTKSIIVVPATEIQTIQIAEGNVCPKLQIPIYMTFPRLFTCPTLLSKNFKIEFELNLFVVFKDEYLVTETFPIVLHRFNARWWAMYAEIRQSHSNILVLWKSGDDVTLTDKINLRKLNNWSFKKMENILRFISFICCANNRKTKPLYGSLLFRRFKNGDGRFARKKIENFRLKALLVEVDAPFPNIDRFICVMSFAIRRLRIIRNMLSDLAIFQRQRRPDQLYGPWIIRAAHAWRIPWVVEKLARILWLTIANNVQWKFIYCFTAIGASFLTAAIDLYT